MVVVNIKQKNGARAFSVVAPKSFEDFLAKIKKTFNLENESQLLLQRGDEEIDEKSYDHNEFKHKEEICFEIVQAEEPEEEGVEGEQEGICEEGEEDKDEDEEGEKEEMLPLASANSKYVSLHFFTSISSGYVKKETKDLSQLLQPAFQGPFGVIRGEKAEPYLTLNNLASHQLRISRRLIDEDVEQLGSLQDVQNALIVILLCHGGMFAGAVYQGGQCIAHKTFRRYVVRAKRGGRQITKDASRGGSFGSVGSMMRRHHETRLREEIHQLLVSWQQYLTTAYRIFLHAPGQVNRDILYGHGDENVDLHTGEPLPGFLIRGDDRIFSIPFNMRQANLEQASLAYRTLFTALWTPPFEFDENVSTQ